jgi:hypothetical protein
LSRHSLGNSERSGGVSVFGVVQIVFIILKLCNVIDWSWWCVFIPSFVSLGLILMILLIALGVCLWDDVRN